ncbi:MAG: hypothetical protein J6X45_04635 [Lachnospiraceae bacterium]|nr:hypothetical protein [Lachnospiraceae bacterium]
MDKLIIIGFIVGALILALIINFVGEKKKVKNFEKKLKANFGKLARKEYDPEKKNSYRAYYKKHQNDNSFSLDDITWNDAEGETLFTSINNCYSSCGEEYLYYRLRNVDLNASKEDIDEYVSQTDKLIEDEETRIKLQLAFAMLGKTGRHSVFDYISLLGNVKRIPLFIFFIIWIGYIAGIASIFVIGPTAGICFLVTWMIVCLILSIYNKKTIEAYMTSFEYIVRSLKTTEKIVGMKIPMYEKESKRLAELRKELNGIRTSFLSFIQTSNRIGIADLASGMVSLFNSFVMIDLFLFNLMLKFVIDKEDTYDEIFSILGKMESQIAIANLKASFEDTCVPEFVDERHIKAEDMIHPLVENCVANSYDAKRGMLITGSNASGKSTFLRCVLVNTILAETVYVACAKNFSLKKSYIYSSMSLKDSLGGGESYYMAEINSIKRIIDSLEAGYNIICFLDEVLRGTNTVERVAAATEILRVLDNPNAMSFAATHDIELTYLLEENYDNSFFREEFRKEEGSESEDICFTYKINEGRSDTRNALKLLEIKGYPTDMCEKAKRLSQNFISTGEWKSE